MNPVLTVSPLVGRVVRLEPLSRGHVDGLVVAAAEDRSTYRFTSVPDGRDEVMQQVDALLSDHAAGETVPFAQVRVADDAVVGCTRFMTLRFRKEAPLPYAVEIGGTWLAASAQRSGLNREAKLLLLDYAFGEWGVGRVDLKTDARNDRSRNAMSALGATFEGVFRQWQPSLVPGEETLLRDSAFFSIVAAEWPAVRAMLPLRG
jgi:RimJ/RimL family protein N-acetyltransferase